MPTGVYPRPSLKERFWAKVKKTDSCWLWTGARTENGHGVFGVSPRVVRKAHRVAWFLAFGVWPKQINHRCPNAHCVRLEHLYEGTQRQNMHDAIEAGTFRSGRTTTAKLTEAQVAEIRARYKPKIKGKDWTGRRASTSPTQRSLAAEYGVSSSAIYLILKGVNWSR